MNQQQTSISYIGSFLICLSYAVTALSMNLGNKVMISYYNFYGTFIYLMIQYMIAVFTFTVLKFSTAKDKVPSFNWSDAVDSLPIAGFYLFSIVFGLIGMSLINLPMYVALRKLVCLKVFVLDIVLKREIPGFVLALGVFLISAGAFIAGSNDLTFDIRGFIFTILANIFTTLQLHYSKIKSSQNFNMTPIAQVYYNSFLSLPFVFILSVTIDEHIDLITHPYVHMYSFWIVLIIFSTLGVLNNYTLFLCSSKISPMATSVTGNLKDGVSMIIGLIAFPDVVPTQMFLIGLTTSMMGALVYTGAKLTEGNVNSKGKL